MVDRQLERPPETLFVRPPPAQPPLGPPANGGPSSQLLGGGRVFRGSLSGFLTASPRLTIESTGLERHGGPVGVVGSRCRSSGTGRVVLSPPPTTGGETIERRGQRVMAVRGGQRFLRARCGRHEAGVAREFGRGLLDVQRGPGAGKALSVSFHA